MSFKEERLLNIKELFKKIDFEVTQHILKYSEEKIHITCNKCKKEQRIDFHFAYSKIKRNTACICHNNDIPEDLSDYQLANFQLYYNAMHNQVKDRNEELKIFLSKEQDLVADLIFKNRDIKNYNKDGKDYIVKCKCDHLFIIKFTDLISGKKWCECSIDNKGE